MENCRLPENKPDKYKRKKAMCAIWDDLEGSKYEDDRDNEEARVFFMALKDK